ncbi:MAG: radical SAM protein [Thermoprotei archaeon]
MRKFTAVSVTGSSCSLNCFYCSAKYISSMEAALTPEELEKFVRRAYSRGTRGFLISGGFDERGVLNVRPYLRVLRALKRELEGLVLNLHPGLQDRETIEEMRDVIDVVDFEFAYSPKAFASKGLRGRTREDYVKVLEYFVEYGPEHVVPHVMLGLPNDEVKEAIEVASSFRPYLINFLVLIPTKGTPSGRLPLPRVEEVLKAIELGHSLNGGRVGLGCMRPHALKEALDREAVAKGLVRRVANPHPRVVKEFGLELYDACCSLPEELLEGFRLASSP